MFATILLLIATLTVRQDAYCIRDDGVSVGVVLAGTEVEVLEQDGGRSLIFSERHGQECWLDNEVLGIVESYVPPELPWFVIAQTEQWRPIVDYYIDDFENLTPELVLAVIANESWGNRYAMAVEPNGLQAVGLCMINARPWLGTVEQLRDPVYNVWTCMWMLDNVLEKTGGDIRDALGAFNCGFESLEAGHCSAWGGYHYAERVMRDIGKFR